MFISTVANKEACSPRWDPQPNNEYYNQVDSISGMKQTVGAKISSSRDGPQPHQTSTMAINQKKLESPSGVSLLSSHFTPSHMQKKKGQAQHTPTSGGAGISLTSDSGVGTPQANLERKQLGTP